MARANMNALIKELGGEPVTKASKDTFVVISDEGNKQQTCETTVLLSNRSVALS